MLVSYGDFVMLQITAYAAVVYIVARDGTSRLVRFVTSKIRDAPTQTKTISRLELLSALLLARLISSVSLALDSHIKLASPKCL